MKETKTIEQRYQKYQAVMQDYHSGIPEKKSKAVETIINDLYVLVVDIVNKCYPTVNKADKEDLIQAGLITIVENMDKYDPTVALPSTFFVTRIKGSVYSYFTENIFGVKKNDITNLNKINAAIEKLKKQGLEPTPKNIVAMTEERITREVIYTNTLVNERSRNQIRLDKDVDNNYTLLDNFKQDERTPEQEFLENEQKEIVYKALQKLSEDERNVIDCLVCKEMSVHQTSLFLGITQSKIKKIRTSAYIKLKNSPILKEYLGIKEEANMSFKIKFRDDIDIDFSEIDDVEMDL